MKNLFDNRLEEEMVNNLKSLEIKPPADLWDSIEKSLDQKKRKQIILITTWAMAATITLFIAVSTFVYFYRATSIPIQLSTNSNLSVQVAKPNPIIVKIEKENLTSGNKKEMQRKIMPSEVVLIKEEDNPIEQIEEKNISGTQYIPDRINKRSSLVLAFDSSREIIERLKGINQEPTQGNMTIEDTEVSKKSREWIISASGFPVYSFHTQGVTNPSNEYGIVSWGGSISIRTKISRSLSIESGLNYSLFGQLEKNIYLVSSDANNLEVTNSSRLTNSFGQLSIPNIQLKVMDIELLNNLSYDAINRSSFDKVNALQQFRYIEMPIQLVKSFSTKGMGINLKAGLSLGYLVGNNLVVSNSTINVKGKTIGVDRFIPSSLLSVGFAFPVSRNIRLSIEPSFRLGLKPLSDSNGKTYPFSTYCKIGFEIPLN